MDEFLVPSKIRRDESYVTQTQPTAKLQKLLYCTSTSTRANNVEEALYSLYELTSFCPNLTIYSGYFFNEIGWHTTKVMITTPIRLLQN
jgi:hypothetical protein